MELSSKFHSVWFFRQSMRCKKWLPDCRWHRFFSVNVEYIGWSVETIMLGKCVSGQGSCDDVSSTYENLAQVRIFRFILYHFIFFFMDGGFFFKYTILILIYMINHAVNQQTQMGKTPEHWPVSTLNGTKKRNAFPFKKMDCMSNLP